MSRLKGRLSTARSVVAFGALSVLAVVVAVVVGLMDRRTAAMGESRRQNETLALVLAEQAAQTFHSVDLAIMRMVDRIEANGATNIEAFRAGFGEGAVHDELYALSTGLRQLDALILLDAEGRLVNFSRRWPVPPGTFSDRDYVRAMRADPALRRFIGAPVRNRITGTLTIYLAHRASAPDGSLLGFVVGAIQQDYLAGFYRAAAAMEGVAVTLTRADGAVLASHPAPPPQGGETPAAATAPATDPTPGERQIGVTRSVRGFPMSVTVARDLSVINGEWRDSAMMLLVGAAVVILCLWTLTGNVARLVAARERSERFLAAALENTNQGVMMLTPDRKIAVLNQRAVELLDLPPEVKAGSSADDVLRHQWQAEEFGRDGSELSGELRPYVVSGDFLNSPPVYERRRPNGTILEVRTSRLDDGGAVRTYTDLTERKKAEDAVARARAAEEASRMKSEFLANMSHELRTPLNAIIGFSEVLEAELFGPLVARQKDYVRDIHASGNHLLGIVSDLLDLAKAEAGSISLEITTVDVGDVLRQVERMTRDRAAAGGLALQVRASGAPALATDARRLRQVLLNLVSNAIKFTPPGGAVRLTAEGIDDAIRIEVADNGIGIAPEDLELVLSPFGQVDSSLSRRHEGTGLGLTLAKRFTERLGGCLELESTPGAGTRVRLTLPTGRFAESERDAA